MAYAKYAIIFIQHVRKVDKRITWYKILTLLKKIKKCVGIQFHVLILSRQEHVHAEM